MTISEILVQLREIATELPRPGCDWEERPRFEPPSSPQVISELERNCGFALPVDLREFLGHVESIVAMSIHNGYWIGGIAQLSKENALPRFVDGESAIPVATDGGGSAFLMGANGLVWRWNRETDESKLVAASFSEFLERVAADWRAYISDARDWKFLV